MGKFSRLGNDLYTGKKSIDFVGRKWLWYSGSGLIVLLAVGGLYFQGLNMGIEFEGGAQYRVTLPSDQVTQDNADKLREAVAATGIDGASSPVVTTTGDNGIIVQTKQLNSADSQEVVDTILQTRRGDAGATCRRTRSARAGARTSPNGRCTGLIVFLILVVLFIWAYFREWKMSVAALVALAHDVLITVGVYALSGLRGLAGHGHGHPDDPRLLALRHRRGVRQGPREHQEPPVHAHDVRRGRQPRRQPDPGAVDQHLDRGADPGRRDPLRRRGPARQRAR